MLGALNPVDAFAVIANLALGKPSLGLNCLLRRPYLNRHYQKETYKIAFEILHQPKHGYSGIPDKKVIRLRFIRCIYIPS